jgi:hypothetical protein
LNANSKIRTLAAALLVAVLLTAVAALALAAPRPGKGQASAAQYAYGQNKVSICHKDKTIQVAQPAVKAHLGHGDTLGSC